MSDPTGHELSAFDHLPEPPSETVDGAALLARVLDALCFRYRWAVDGLDAEDLSFRATEGAFDLRELLDHMRTLARWVETNLLAARHGTEPVVYTACCEGLPDPGGDPMAYAAQTLGAWRSARIAALELGAEGLQRVVLVGGREPTPFPIWNMVNGPLADAFTHIGQLSAWRRQLGKPAPRADVFRGRPPKR